MRYRHVLSRRTLLRGAGTIAIGLPFLDEMRTTSVYAQPPDSPTRAVTVFFALGMPNHVQEDFLGDLGGPLEPLRPVGNKLSFVRGLRFPFLDPNGHVSGGMGPFTGAAHPSRFRAGGPSVDQVILQERYPEGPPGLIPTVGMGVSGAFRDNVSASNPDEFHRVSSWRNDGSPSITPKELPSELFVRVFGSGGLPAGQQRIRRSVLDSVIGQYRYFTSPASNLGASSRSRIQDHLDRIREYERRAFQPDVARPIVCRGVEEPSNPDVYRGQRSTQGVDLQVADLQSAWRLNADLVVMALRCDLTRFAWTHFLNTGDRVDLRGPYRYDGRLVYDFNDTRDQFVVPEAGLDPGVNHEHFHFWDRRDDDGARVGKHHLHFHMSEVAYLLSQLDDPAHTDENGGTLLDNAMVMVTTELGDHGSHDGRNVLHMVGGSDGRFRTGGSVIRAGGGDRPAADLYNTVLRAYGIDRTMAPDFFRSTIDELRA